MYVFKRYCEYNTVSFVDRRNLLFVEYYCSAQQKILPQGALPVTVRGVTGRKCVQLIVNAVANLLPSVRHVEARVFSYEYVPDDGLLKRTDTGLTEKSRCVECI